MRCSAFYLAHLPSTAGRRSTARSSGCTRRCSTSPSWCCRRCSASCPTATGHHRVMLFGPIFGAIAVVLTGADDQRSSLLGGDAHPRGRIDAPRASRRSSGSSPWRRPATRSCAARRPPGSRPRRWPGSGSGSIVGVEAVRGRRPGGLLPQRRPLRHLVPDLQVRGQGSGRRGGGGRRRRMSAFSRYLDLIRTVACPAPGPDLDRGQRGIGVVAQPVALPARQGRTRSSRTRR